MQHKLFWLILLSLTLNIQQTTAQKLQLCKCVYKTKAPANTPFDLYSPTTDIVVLSYTERLDEDIIIVDEDSSKTSNDCTQINKREPIYEWVAKVGDEELIIPKALDSIVLNNAQKDKLFKILHLYQQKQNQCVRRSANCYSPHYLILFYQNKQIVAFLEVCLLCTGHRKSKNIPKGLFDCPKKYKLLKNFFEEIGVKNHLQYEFKLFED
jgi:hypothetical protein